MLFNFMLFYSLPKDLTAANSESPVPKRHITMHRFSLFLYCSQLSSEYFLISSFHMYAVYPKTAHSINSTIKTILPTALSSRGETALNTIHSETDMGYAFPKPFFIN